MISIDTVCPMCSARVSLRSETCEYKGETYESVFSECSGCSEQFYTFEQVKADSAKVAAIRERLGLPPLGRRVTPPTPGTSDAK